MQISHNILQVDLERKRRCGISRENILNNLYCPAAGDKKSGDSKPSDTRLASASAVCIGKSISRIICLVKKKKKEKERLFNVSKFCFC